MELWRWLGLGRVLFSSHHVPVPNLFESFSFKKKALKWGREWSGACRVFLVVMMSAGYGVQVLLETGSS